jgi:hypothetical protein
MIMARIMVWKQDLIWRQDAGHMKSEVMTAETAEVVDALRVGVVNEMEKNVLATGSHVNLTEEEVILGGVVIETKNNREFKI